MAQAELLFGYMTLVVRTAGEVPGLLDRLQDAAVAIDPAEPLYDFDTMETLLADATARDRLAAIVFGAFAILAIALSAAGIYGVVSYQMARRTREIGLRMALGASRSRVLRKVVGEAAALALLGIALGAAVAAAGTRLVASFLHGVSAHDPLTYFGVSALLLTIAVVAALVPALRAASIHPVEALRCE
jgi:ABC-type antimicrobial peptide transport system permease subunit